MKPLRVSFDVKSELYHFSGTSGIKKFISLIWSQHLLTGISQ